MAGSGGNQAADQAANRRKPGGNQAAGEEHARVIDERVTVMLREGADVDAVLAGER